MDEIYIFGAGSRSQTLGVYLKKLNSELRIIAYLIDNDEKNPDAVDGVPVIHLRSNMKLDTTRKVYIGTKTIYHNAIIEKLTILGFERIISNTPTLDMELRNEFLKYFYGEWGRSFDKLMNITSCEGWHKNLGKSCIYVICSISDEALTEKGEVKPWRKILQAGAALTDISISDLKDNMGDNISNKNKQFCELTGLYWIWKNSDEDIVGLEHNRRHFLLPDDWQKRMQAAEIDVILPTPLYVHPSLAENYRARHVTSDLDFVYTYVADNNPEDGKGFKYFMENTPLYSPCNMLIVRRETLKRLSEWLFPILFAVEEHVGERDDSCQNRYPGFLSERLMTFYFEKNRDRYKIVYCDKNFLK